MNNKKDYLRHFQVLREIVNKHDPMSLMDIAPEDEYDAEVGKILADTYRLESLEEIKNIVYDIFVASFGDDVKLAKGLCQKIAEEWFVRKNDD